MKLFIADGSALVRERLKSAVGDLEETQIVGLADDFAEAVEMLPRLNPDVVILDIHILGGSGIDILKEIKSEASSPVVIVLTNHSSLEYRKICQELGADHFFDKAKELEKAVEILRQLAKSDRFQR